MKLHILSDIHLEFSDMPIPEVDADVTIVAGDLHTGISGLWWARKLGRPVVYIPGNHEFYGYDMDKIRDAFRQQKSSITLDNEVAVLNGVSFLGCTLWTDFNYHNDPIFDMIHAKRNMNDFKFIKYQSFRLKPEDTIELHKESLSYMRTQQPDVIITHHLPSSKSVSARYGKDTLTSAFASNLDNIVAESDAKLWIHGHTHSSHDYTIGNTRVICNPRGYPPFNQQFNPNLVVDV